MTYGLNSEAPAFSYTREELFECITKIVSHSSSAEARALAIFTVFDDYFTNYTESDNNGGYCFEMTRFIKNPDEIVLEDVKMVHYETMEQGRAVWLGIYLNNGQIFHLNIGGDNLYVNYSDETVD